MGGFPLSGYSWIIWYCERSSFAVIASYFLCNVVSIGSKGTGSLAHIAAVSSSCSCSLNESFSCMIFIPPPGVYMPASVILFSVMVPVLSTQITVALPRVSTVFICLTMMPIFISRQAPSAINVVKATGISSGRMLMARASALRRLSRISRER